MPLLHWACPGVYAALGVFGWGGGGLFGFALLAVAVADAI